MDKNLEKIVFAPAEKQKRKTKQKKEKIIPPQPDLVGNDKDQEHEPHITLLSLDPAHSCGWSIFKIYKESNNIHLIKCDFLEIDTKSDYIGDACISLKTQVKEIIENFNVDEVCVEDYFMSSRKCQGANMNVYFRGAIYILCRELNIHYDIIPVWGWKSFVSGQITPNKEMKKYYGKELANKIFIQEALWIRYKLRFPNYSISKNTGKPISIRYDMIDSVGIGLFHIHKRYNCQKLVNKLEFPLGLSIELKTKKKSFQYDD